MSNSESTASGNREAYRQACAALEAAEARCEHTYSLPPPDVPSWNPTWDDRGDAATRRMLQAFADATEAYEQALRDARQAIRSATQAVLATAPSQPTDWWPGGWVIIPSEHSPEWPERGLIWRTEQEARSARPPGLPKDRWVPRWTPVDSATPRSQWLTRAVSSSGRHLSRLDAFFWQHNDSPVHYDDSPSKELSGFVDAALWVGTAAASGMLGNAAYDVAKIAARRIFPSQRQDADNDVAPPPTSAPDDRPPATAKRELDLDLPPASPPVIDPGLIDP